jgi:hypothetical protein
MRTIRRETMLTETRSKRVVSCLVALAVAGSAGMGLPNAKGWGRPSLIPQKAFNPIPHDGATAVTPEDVSLEWAAGPTAVSHKVYFGTDLALVASGSTMVYQGTQHSTTFCVGGLELATTYYWRVDEVDADGYVTTGYVWGFTTSRFSPVR